MKKIFILITILFPLLSFAYTSYPTMIEEQLQIIQKMNDHTTDKQTMLELVKERKHIYITRFEDILINKDDFTKNLISYDDHISALSRIIKRNKRLKHIHAQKRDEVKINIYQIFNAQRDIADNILISLNSMNFKDYEKNLNSLIEENNSFVNQLANAKYNDYLELDGDSEALKELQHNVNELNNIIEINKDLNQYLKFFKKRIYSLEEYGNYSFIHPVLKINNLPKIKILNSYLEKIGLSVVTILMIFTLSIILYLFNKLVLKFTEKLLKKATINQEYFLTVYNAIKKYFTLLIIVFNINLSIFILNYFVEHHLVKISFKVIYSIIFTIIILKILNAISTIKITKMGSGKTEIKSELINVGIKIANFIIIIIGIILILYSLDVDLTAVLSGLGIGGLAIALASKDSLANFFGTISILASDTFSQGDWIEIDDKDGTVVEIGLRVTTIRTFDNALISIPNANLANTDIVNWSRRELGRRIKMTLGVKYNSKSEDIKNAIKEIREMLIKHPKIASKNTEFKMRKKTEAKILSYEDAHGIKKTLLVYLDEFGDSSINILIYCFAKTIDWAEWLEVKEEIMHQMMEIFEKNSLEFAFPSISIYNEP